MSYAPRIAAIVDRLRAAGQPFDALVKPPFWVEAIEAKFGRRLPAAYRCLLSGYGFPEFEINGVMIFANLNDSSPMDITVAPFADRVMSAWLLGRGYVQFGRPASGSYDPVCFDFNFDVKEQPVVVLDHEDILLERRKVRAEKLADSFLDLLEAGLHKTALPSDAPDAPGS